MLGPFPHSSLVEHARSVSTSRVDSSSGNRGYCDPTGSAQRHPLRPGGTAVRGPTSSSVWASPFDGAGAALASPSGVDAAINVECVA